MVNWKVSNEAIPNIIKSQSLQLIYLLCITSFILTPTLIPTSSSSTHNTATSRSTNKNTSVSTATLLTKIPPFLPPLHQQFLLHVLCPLSPPPPPLLRGLHHVDTYPKDNTPRFPPPVRTGTLTDHRLRHRPDRMSFLPTLLRKPSYFDYNDVVPNSAVRWK